jgi:hypothetical protein
MTRSKKAPGDYAVGYGKPPLHTRFRKGVSGNPGGRPSKAPLERIKTLALREACRAVPVKDGGDTVTLPAIRAVLRRQLALAAEGNGPAQRAIIATIAAFEEERTIVDSIRAAEEAERRKPMDDAEAIRRIAWLLNLPERDKAAREMQERLRKDEEQAREKLRAARAASRGVAGAAALGTTDEQSSALQSSSSAGNGAGAAAHQGAAASPTHRLPQPKPRIRGFRPTRLSDRNRQQPISIGGGTSEALPYAIALPARGGGA